MIVVCLAKYVVSLVLHEQGIPIKQGKWGTLKTHSNDRERNVFQKP